MPEACKQCEEPIRSGDCRGLLLGGLSAGPEWAVLIKVLVLSGAGRPGWVFGLLRILYDSETTGMMHRFEPRPIETFPALQYTPAVVRHG